MANNTRRDTGNNKANDTSVESATSGGAAGTPSLPIVPGAGPTPEGSGPIANVDARASGDYAHELDITGEFPKLVVSDALYGGEETEKAEEAGEGNTEPAPVDSPSAQERTSFWLQHLESEVQRLQGKFESVAAELRVREARISGLRGQVEAKDALLNDLRRQIDEQGGALSALRTDLEQANARIADLIAGEAAGEINLAQAEADLQEARQVAANTKANRDKLLEKIARLSDAVDRDAKAAAGAQQLYEDEAKRTSGLRARIEELDTYIEGSKKRWLAVHDELADYRNKLGVSERRLAEALAASMAETQARERLATEAVSLEGRLEELGAQLAGGEVARRELTSRLEEERAATTRLREDVATAAARGDQALTELNARDKRIAELERLVSAHLETVAGLEERERQRERSESDLLAEKNDLVGRAAALEQSLLQRQDDVRIAVEAGAEKERDLRGAQQKIARLEGLLSEAAREINELASAIDARENTISRLEADLHPRHDAAAVLERSVRRLAEIDTGMAGLERLLVSTADGNAPSSSDGQAPAVSPDSDGAVPSRRMVDAIGGDKPPYPARRVETTIDQSDSSDIQIQPRVTRPG
jgi:predicted  nucleic acid-binding Zn-ribbon protein